MQTLMEMYRVYIECKTYFEKQMKEDLDSDLNREIELLYQAKVLTQKQFSSMRPEEKYYESYETALLIIKSMLGQMYMETKELDKAREIFLDCLATISDPLDPRHIIVSIEARNELGLLFYNKSELEEAKKILEEAENMFKEFRRLGRVVCLPFPLYNEDKEKNLEMRHTMTKMFLVQVYRDLNYFLKAAIYSHETLNRELLTTEYDPVDWAVNSATLSQFFLHRALFKQARLHLAAASYILDNYEEKLKDIQGSEEDIENKKEVFRHRSADVYRHWAKYGIFLLEHSKNLLRDKQKEEKEEKEEEENKEESEEDKDKAEEEENHNELENMCFDDLNLSIYESQITDSEVVTYEDAREVFLISQKYLNKAKEYYTLETMASDHVKIVMDHSMLFAHLSAFEPDEERQFKMNRKRINILEVVLNELNPRYYIDMCRMIWVELGVIYLGMTQIMVDKLKKSSGHPTPQAMMKLNALTEASIVNFNLFLDSLRDIHTKKLPEDLPQELAESVVCAHFYLGRLYYSYITLNINKQVESTKKAYTCFKYVVDYCEKNKTVKNLIHEEYNVSQEMMTLLKMRVLKL